VAVALYSAGATWGILKLVALVARVRATAREEGLGLDVTQHGEEAYGSGEGAILVLPEGEGPALALSEPVLAPGGGAS
jgi:Amt family ammonium transporter